MMASHLLLRLGRLMTIVTSQIFAAAVNVSGKRRLCFLVVFLFAAGVKN